MMTSFGALTVLVLVMVLVGTNLLSSATYPEAKHRRLGLASTDYGFDVYDMLPG